MTLPVALSEIALRQGGMVTSRQAVRAGVSRQMMLIYVREGLLERVERGLFVTADGVVDDLLMLSFKVPDGVFSHGTALYLNGLTDRTPFEPTMTIDRECVLTGSLRKIVKNFYVSKELLELGRTMRQTPMGNAVVTYDCERTICDLIRSRKRLDDELVLDGLRQYAAMKDKNIAKLGEYAEALGILGELKRTMEVVL